MMRWINRNIGPEGCAAIGLLLILTLVVLFVLIFGFLVLGPVVQQIERAL